MPNANVHWALPMASQIVNAGIDMVTHVRIHTGSYPPWQITHNAPLDQEILGLHTIKSCSTEGVRIVATSPITSPIIDSNTLTGLDLKR
jgi:hypothetical protein